MGKILPSRLDLTIIPGGLSKASMLITAQARSWKFTQMQTTIHSVELWAGTRVSTLIQ